LEINLGTNFGAVENSSGAASGTNFGEQISGISLGSSFVNRFLEQKRGAMICGTIFDNIFWE
jgi:hypothetical protein